MSLLAGLPMPVTWCWSRSSQQCVHHLPATRVTSAAPAGRRHGVPHAAGAGRGAAAGGSDAFSAAAWRQLQGAAACFRTGIKVQLTNRFQIVHKPLLLLQHSVKLWPCSVALTGISRRVFAIVPSASFQGFARAPPEPPGDTHVLFQHFWVEKGPLPLPQDGVETDGGSLIHSRALTFALCFHRKADHRRAARRSGSFLSALAEVDHQPEGSIPVPVLLVPALCATSSLFAPSRAWPGLCADAKREGAPAQPGARRAAAPSPHPATGAPHMQPALAVRHQATGLLRLRTWFRQCCGSSDGTSLSVFRRVTRQCVPGNRLLEGNFHRFKVHLALTLRAGADFQRQNVAGGVPGGTDRPRVCAHQQPPGHRPPGPVFVDAGTGNAI